MFIKFNNTRHWIRPNDGSVLALQNGFTANATLPQWTPHVLSAEQTQAVTKSSQSILLLNIGLNEIMNNSLQIIFGQIIQLQILAHVPLTNLELSVEAMQRFDIMIQIVSFDYFPIHNYFPEGTFTETEPWAAEFATVGYETVNVVECLGSINLVIWFGVLYVLFVIALHWLKIKYNC